MTTGKITNMTMVSEIEVRDLPVDYGVPNFNKPRNVICKYLMVCPLTIVELVECSIKLSINWLNFCPD